MCAKYNEGLLMLYTAPVILSLTTHLLMPSPWKGTMELGVIMPLLTSAREISYLQFIIENDLLRCYQLFSLPLFYLLNLCRLKLIAFVISSFVLQDSYSPEWRRPWIMLKSANSNRCSLHPPSRPLWLGLGLLLWREMNAELNPERSRGRMKATLCSF